MNTLEIVDLFCGAGGTSTGALDAARRLGYAPRLTAVNHWETAVATHCANHPDSVHLCASVDSLNPRTVMAGRTLDLLWASPECTHFSNARGGVPMNDQSRASAHCVTRWADALRPPIILVENVREFLNWGPLGRNNRPIKSKRGATFRAWVAMIESLGYAVEWRILCAADYGDPTTRQRLFIQAIRKPGCPAWPSPTHQRPESGPGLFESLPPWRSAREIIDWSVPGLDIATRKRSLSKNTLKRIESGLRRFGGAEFIVVLRGTSGDQISRSVKSLDSPLPTVSAGGTHVAICEPFLIPQHTCGRPRSVSEPVPTIAASGAIAIVEPFIIKYYGTGGATQVSEPLDTVTTKNRFGLVQPNRKGIRFRMLQPNELAAAQGFPAGYQFTGNKADVIRQIGNAVPCGMARALVHAVLARNPHLHERQPHNIATPDSVQSLQ